MTRRPTLRAVRLGQELRRLREDHGATLRQLASDLDVNVGRLSKKESGWLPAKRHDIDDYLQALDVSDGQRREDLYKIGDDVFQKGWWDGYASDIAGTLMDRIWLESKAIRIDTYEVMALPGLLQIPQYAEALMKLARPDASEVDLKRWIEVRTTRQHILTRHDPITYRAVIDEAVLHRQVADQSVMAKQIEYLASAAEQHNIEIRILPFSAGMPPSLTGSFEVIGLEHPYPPAGLLQVPGGDVCVEGDTIDALERDYDRLLDSTLSSSATKKHLKSERARLR